MDERITVTGVVGTSPRAITTAEGLSITSFRLASTQRRFDRADARWVDGDTHWFTVSTFRRLAEHVAASVDTGDRVVVAGRLRLRDWQSERGSGTSVEVDAHAVGHDLAWGPATPERARSRTGGAPPAPDEPEVADRAVVDWGA